MFTTGQPPGLALYRQLTTQLHDLVFPPRCIACDAMGARLCDTCAQKVQPAAAPLCARCGRLQAAACATCATCARAEHVLTRVRAAALHAGVMRDAIHALKYDGAHMLATPLARYLVAAWQHSGWDDLRATMDLVAPVPLHASRLRERGYNQSALLAEAFCRQSGLVFQSGALQRVRATQSQVGLDASARVANVAAAFTADQPLHGKHVLLIDDVYTTGATLNACAQAALNAGAATVSALTLALPGARPDPGHG